MATTLDTFIPFDAGAGASVTEGQWRSMAERWLTDGVVAGVTNELAVAQRAAGANMSVDVATGEARVRGHQGVSTSIKNLTVTANGSGNPRVDLVVLRADFANNRIELDVLEGTAAAAPVEPALTQSASVWEIPLAAIAVANAAASIVTADLRDRRTLTRTPTQMFVKEPVRFATTAALAASTVSGTKRTANANGAFPATDGVTAVAGDRLLDKDHATAAQRGIWRLVELGSASRPWVMERPADFDESRDVADGLWVVVNEGTLYAGSGWLQTANNPITLGTTSLAFTRSPAAAELFLAPTQFIVVSAGPTLANVGGGVDIQAWAMDAGSIEQVIAQVAVPTGWGTVAVDLYWTNLGAGSGNVVWTLFSFQAADGQGVNAGALTDTMTPAAPAQNILKVSALAPTISVTPGSLMVLYVRRAAADGADTLGNDAGLLGVNIRRLT